MVEAAALPVDEVFLEQPVRKWVLSFPYPLRFRFSCRLELMGKVLAKSVASQYMPVLQRGRDKLERLYRYFSRPAVSEKRLSLTSRRVLRYQLKTPYRDGTTYAFFELNSKLRARVTPAKRDRGRQSPGQVRL